MENELILYGASGHCKVVMDVILSTNYYQIKTILDDNCAITSLYEYPVVPFLNYENNYHYAFFISIGNNEIRRKISSKWDVNYVKLIHYSAIVSCLNVSIGNGTVVMMNAIINPSVTIGTHCIINSGAIVEHDCKIADYVHVCPGAKLAGNVEVGEGTMIGLGSSIIQGVKIGKWVTIGAGAVIIKDVPDYAVVVGNPGKIIKYKDHGK